MVKVWIDPIYADFLERIERGFEVFFEAGGIRAEFVRDAKEADYFYSAGQQIFAANTRAAKVNTWTQLSSRSQPTPYENLWLPSEAVDGAHHDPVLAAFFFVSGSYESVDLATEPHGVPSVEVVKKWNLDSSAVLQHLQIKSSASLPKSRAPRWPKNKKFAVAISHDCDRPFLYRPWGYLKDAKLYLKRNQPGSFLSAIAKSIYSSAKFFTTTDPFEKSFQKWIQFEERTKIRSAFYFGAWSRFDSDAEMEDLPYQPFARKIKSRVQFLLDGGWEVGLHSSTAAWKLESGYSREAIRFQENFGFRPTGMRAHCWSLEPGSPERSLQSAAQAGFAYDCSLGMNSISGFRRGSAYPFRIFNRQGKNIGLTELPTTILDWSIFVSGSSPQERLQEFRKKIQLVREVGGLFYIDWHDYALAPVMGNFGKILLSEIESLAHDSDCWMALPKEISEWVSKERWQANF